MSAIQGLLIIEVNGRTVGTFRIVSNRLSLVSAVEGYRIPLYVTHK